MTIAGSFMPIGRSACLTCAALGSGFTPIAVACPLVAGFSCPLIIQIAVCSGLIMTLSSGTCLWGPGPIS